MELIRNFIQIHDKIIKVRSFKEGFITNFFLSEKRCNMLIEKQLIFIIDFEKSTLILQKDYDFYHLYYIATNIDSLEIILINLNNNSNNHKYVTDLVGKEEALSPLVFLFKKYNYNIYSRLYRMSRIIDSEVHQLIDARIEYPEPINSIKILNLLELYFDRYCEQIPLLEEITQWIHNKNVLVIYEKQEIIGFVIFEINGSTSYLRYWFTHPNHREKKVGSALLRRFFFESRFTKRQLFWVIDSNDNAIIKYKHYGFDPEPMYDYVMLKQ